MAYLLSPIRINLSFRGYVRSAKIVKIKRLSDVALITPSGHQIMRQETMSKTAITLAYNRMNIKSVEFNCQHCGRTFYHAASLEAHQDMHDGDTLPRPLKFIITKTSENLNRKKLL